MPHLSPEDQKLLHELRQSRPAHRRHHEQARTTQTTGQRVSDWVATVVGSWGFIIVQSVLLVLWMVANVVALMVRQWDPYPFILLNLVLSFEAAFTAPIIMMSQNRQADIDRRAAKGDYDVNLKAELEIESLHAKLDVLMEQEMLKLFGTIEALHKQIECLQGELATERARVAANG